MTESAEVIVKRIKDDVDHLGGLVRTAEGIRVAERERAAKIACRRRYWPFGRLIARRILEEDATWPQD